MEENTELIQLCLNTRCNYCRSECRDFKRRRMEFGSPREKIEIVYETLNGRLNPKEASDNLFHCISCKKCSSACPYNIDTSKILWDNKRLFENCPRKYFFILAYVFSKLFRISYRG